MNRTNKTASPNLLCQDQFAAMWASLGDTPKPERRNQMPTVKPLNMPGMPNGDMPNIIKPRR